MRLPCLEGTIHGDRKFRMTSDKAAAEKILYFNSLAALNDGSDEEYDSNDAREVLRNSRRGSPTPSFSIGDPPERMRTPDTFKKVPVIHRTTSAPVSSTSFVHETPPLPTKCKLRRSESATLLDLESSTVKETPPLVGKSSSRRSKNATSLDVEPPIIKKTPHSLKKTSSRRSKTATSLAVQPSTLKKTPHLPKNSSLRRSESATPPCVESSICHDVSSSIVSNSRFLAERRTVSDPTMGSGALVIPYSKGITTMLGKKRKATGNEATRSKKAKKASFKLVPEGQRIFKDKIFYYIPPDDKAPLRKLRITMAREFGATWTKELIPETTHIVVQKALCRKDVTEFLKTDRLPQGIILVNDEYPLDCMKHRLLLPPDQERYSIDSSRVNKEPKIVSQTTADAPLEIKTAKSKSRKKNIVPLDQTPPRSQGSTRRNLSRHPDEEDGDVNSQGRFSSKPSTEFMVDRELSRSRDSEWQGDELDEAINAARELGDGFMSDEDPEDDSRPSSREGYERSGSEDNAIPQSGKGSFNQENFTCMRGGTGKSSKSNPNAKTIEILQEMSNHFGRIKDQFRERSYRNACGMLRKHPVKVITYEQALVLPGIGDSIARNIQEIVTTGGLQRLTNALMDQSGHSLQTFLKIYGVGETQAWKWVMQGHKTLEDLKAKASLTPNQRLGIDHYDELLIRIPRDEVTALGDIVRTNSALIDPNVEVIIGGSYRRGSADSGDIDFLLTKHGTSTSKDLFPYLRKLVGRLTDIGFWAATLAEGSEKGSSSKWHGCCVLPGSLNPIWRRIDFLLVPETELGAALIYFTGDAIFNRSIRLLAGQKGWRLNQRGLYKDVMRGPGRAKMNEGELIEGADEKKIFVTLGVPWRPPEERICG